LRAVNHAGPGPAAAPVLAPLARRLASLIYEVLLLAALLWCAALVFRVLENALGIAHVRFAFQVYLLAITCAYFVWQWTHGGQTLPMKTWRIRLARSGGEAVTARVALGRYAVALCGTLAFGAAFLWAAVDRERLFLHDRIAGTRIVRC
jgi:uncharacterized RDD family membrane protein YckC